MGLVDRKGQLWSTRTDFGLMYHPTGVEALEEHVHYVVLDSRTYKWDDFTSTHHTIAITFPPGKIFVYTIVENPKKDRKKRFEFMGIRTDA